MTFFIYLYNNMEMLKYLSNSLIFATLFFSPFCASGQGLIRFEPFRASDPGEMLYREHFKSYDLGTIEMAQVSSVLKSQQHVAIEVDGKSFEFTLAARDVRAPHYALRVQTDQGIQEWPRTPNKTYAGKTVEGNLDVRITADAHFFTAMIAQPGDALYIEPARLINPTAGADEFVIYWASDMLKAFEGGMCGVTESTMDPDQDKHAPPKGNANRSGTGTCKVIKLAIADDYLMFQKHESVEAVESHNLAVLNLVQGLYDNELGLEVYFDLVELFIVSTAGSDPWPPSTDANTLLNSFTAWGTTGFSNAPDLASLWTDRDFDGGTIGLAWVDVLCRPQRYNVLQDYHPNMAFLRTLQAHELGHNCGSFHDYDAGFIMSPSITDPPSVTWSTASRNVISIKVDTVGCLQECQSFGQSVGIGTYAPDPSAALDITSTTQGLLVPRMSTADRSSIQAPAKGLLVFDNTSNSFWYRNNSSWVELVDSVNSVIQYNGSQGLYLGLDENVGIGTDTPTHKLHVEGDSRFVGNVTVESDDAHPLIVKGEIGQSTDGIEFLHHNLNQGIGFGYNTIYAAGSGASQLLGLAAKGPEGNLVFRTNNQTRAVITADGNMGIGTSVPHAPLQIGNAFGNRRLVIFENGDNDHQFYGFGINSAILRYQVAGTDKAHVFYAANSTTTSHELMRIKGTGEVGISTSSPDKLFSIANKWGIDVNGTMHSKNSVAHMMHMFEGASSADKMVISHSAQYPDWGLQYVGISNTFRFLGDSSQVMAIDLGTNKVEVNGSLKIGYVRVMGSWVDIPPNSLSSATCDCPAGTVVMGGGYHKDENGGNIGDIDVRDSSATTDTQWGITVKNKNLFVTLKARATAICARLAN